MNNASEGSNSMSKHDGFTRPHGRRGPAWLVGAAGLAVLGVGLAAAPAHRDVPDFLRTVIGEDQPASDRAVAERNVLALDTSMLEIYEVSLAQYKKNMRDHVPIILALFSGAGGRMVLYRPGQPPRESEPVPVTYQLFKSAGHSSMATYQLIAPYLERPADQSWRGPMRAYRAQCQSALGGIDALALSGTDKETLRSILKHNLAFQDECLRKGTFTYEELTSFALGLKDDLPKAIWVAANAQVGHWFKVLEDWKQMLGADWDRTYAATNSLYVTRQNNILFTILAQFMGKEAIGDRLLLFETTEFMTTPDQMLDLLARIVSDRALGKVFFKDYYLMDAELVGGGARRAIIAEATKRGMKPLLPSLAPFRSNDWPWRTDPKKGTGPSSMEDVK
jgi:hypothetical protein